MITPELRAIWSPDVPDTNLETFKPEDPRMFGVLAQTLIGYEDDPDAEESFAFIACSPQWFAGQLGENGYSFGRHHIFMNEYNFVTLTSAILELCASIQGETWAEVTEKLSRYGFWEFEDYQEVPDETQ